MKNLEITFLTILLFMINSCKNVDNKSLVNEFYSSGNLMSQKIYSTQGSIDTVKIYYDTVPILLREQHLKTGEVSKYYKNGKLFLNGYLNQNNLRIGEWSFYNEQGNLSEIREYFIINGQSYLNQNIYFDELGNKLYERVENNLYRQKDFQSENLNNGKSNFFELNIINDTIDKAESLTAVIFYYTPKFKVNKSELVLYLGKFDEQFTNINKIAKDTFFSLTKDTYNKQWFPEDDPNYTVAFGCRFENAGSKVLRGYLSEYYYDSINKLKMIEQKIYFEQKIYVR